MKLRDYQQEAISIVTTNFVSNVKRQLISLPTGTGKTVVFSGLIDECKERGMLKVLVLAHRDELISQAANKIKKVMPDANLGIVKGSHNQTASDVIVASVQTLSRKARLEQFDKDHFDLIVVDEAHHATAPSYLRILGYFGGYDPRRKAKVVGLTATAQRAGLDRVFRLVYHKGIKEMVEKGYLTPPECLQVKTEIDIDSVGIRGGDFDIETLNKKVNTAERNLKVVEKYIELANDEIAVAFCVSVDHAIALTKMFNEKGVKAAYVHAGTPEGQRAQILLAHQLGQINVVCNCGILTEGYDDPAISTILMARPTLSSILYTQMVGRGLRLYEGKAVCKVIDFVDNAEQHNLISLPFLLPDFKDKKRNGAGGTGTTRTVDDQEPVQVPTHELQTTEEEVDLLDFVTNVPWKREGDNLVFRPNNKHCVTVEDRNGFYFITVEEKKKDKLKVATLNKEPFVELQPAVEAAEVYISKMKLTETKKKTRAHSENPNCIELVIYYKKLQKPEVILTPVEIELLEVFLDDNRGKKNINETARQLGCTHTNVWQRLYGGKAGVKGGILKKLNDFFAAA